jgi:hypothetical protein
MVIQSQEFMILKPVLKEILNNDRANMGTIIINIRRQSVCTPSGHLNPRKNPINKGKQLAKII